MENNQPEFIQNEESNSSVVSMSEILDDEIALEEEAEEQLHQNWGDENACTHEQGYISQPVYSCETCYNTKTNPDAKKFGFCYGCSMNCHLHHEVIELFEKRDFKCDCGTPKSKCNCVFDPKHEKTEDNENNIYNHNFDGLYCWCDGPYNCTDMVMYQCIMCQDWYHQECLKDKEKEKGRDIALSENDPEVINESDFVCCDCYDANSFLKYYSHLLVNTSSPTTTTSTSENQVNTSSKRKIDEISEDKKENVEVEVQVENKSLKEEEVVELECLLKKYKSKKGNDDESLKNLNAFFEKGWREKLCECKGCLEMYDKQKVSYLVEEKEDVDVDADVDVDVDGDVNNADTNQKTKKRVSVLDIDENPTMRSIDHQTKVNVMVGFNHMVSNLKDYFKSFADSKKEVTSEDINTFFDGLKNKKRKTN